MSTDHTVYDCPRCGDLSHRDDSAQMDVSRVCDGCIDEISGQYAEHYEVTHTAASPAESWAETVSRATLGAMLCEAIDAHDATDEFGAVETISWVTADGIDHYARAV